MTQRVLDVDGRAETVAPVAIEVAGASRLERRIVRRRVAQTVIRRGELLLAPRIAGDSPGMFGTGRRVEEQGVVATAFRREEHRVLQRPPIRGGVSIVAVDLKDDAVTEPFVGVE